MTNSQELLFRRQWLVISCFEGISLTAGPLNPNRLSLEVLSFHVQIIKAAKSQKIFSGVFCILTDLRIFRNQASL